MINPKTKTEMSREEVYHLFDQHCPRCHHMPLQCTCATPKEVEALEQLIESAEKEAEDLHLLIAAKEKRMSDLRQNLMHRYAGSASAKPGVGRRRRHRAVLEEAGQVTSEPIVRKVSEFSSISRDVAAAMHQDENKVDEMQSRVKKLLLETKGGGKKLVDAHISVRGSALAKYKQSAHRKHNAVIHGLERLQEGDSGPDKDVLGKNANADEDTHQHKHKHKHHQHKHKHEHTEMSNEVGGVLGLFDASAADRAKPATDATQPASASDAASPADAARPDFSQFISKSKSKSQKKQPR